jgi:hypothetical protein
MIPSDDAARSERESSVRYRGSGLNRSSHAHVIVYSSSERVEQESGFRIWLRGGILTVCRDAKHQADRLSTFYLFPGRWATGQGLAIPWTEDVVPNKAFSPQHF